MLLVDRSVVGHSSFNSTRNSEDPGHILKDLKSGLHLSAREGFDCNNVSLTFVIREVLVVTLPSNASKLDSSCDLQLGILRTEE